MSLLYMRMRSVRVTLLCVLSKSCFADNSFVTSVFRRLDCSLVCPSVVNCAPGHSSCAEQADLSVSLSLSHTMCAPAHCVGVVRGDIGRRRSEAAGVSAEGRRGARRRGARRRCARRRGARVRGAIVRGARRRGSRRRGARRRSARRRRARRRRARRRSARRRSARRRS